MISLLITLVILGIVFYCINLIPMAEPYPTVIRIIAILIAVVLVLQFLGVQTGLTLH